MDDTTQTLASLIQQYSPDYDLTEAVAAAQRELVAAVVERDGKFTPVELKVVIEQGLRARLDILVGMIIATLAEVKEWTVDQADQERKAITDGLELVKSHVEARMIGGLDEDQ